MQYFGYSGVLVVGTYRSGSHMACDMLYRKSTTTNKLYLNELLQLPPLNPNSLIFCSIVNTETKTSLAMDLSWMSDYYIVNIRRRNKVAQYISFCILRAQNSPGIYNHAPEWDDYKHLLPLTPTEEDIDYFILIQHLDFVFTPNQIIYYEDLVETDNDTMYIKTQYPVPLEELVTNYEFIKRKLEKYSYNGR